MREMVIRGRSDSLVFNIARKRPFFFTPVPFSFWENKVTASSDLLVFPTRKTLTLSHLYFETILDKDCLSKYCLK